MSAIRLYNHTRIPDEVLRPILTRARRKMAVGGSVFVKVTAARSLQVSGCALDGRPYDGWLRGKRKDKDRLLGVGGPTGFVHLVVPDSRALGSRPDAEKQALSCARYVEMVARHEMAHVSQYREPSYLSAEFFGYRGSAQRRVAHQHRPIEIDAADRVDATEAKSSTEKQRVRALVEALAAAMVAKSEVV